MLAWSEANNRAAAVRTRTMMSGLDWWTGANDVRLVDLPTAAILIVEVFAARHVQDAGDELSDSNLKRSGVWVGVMRML